MIKFFSKGKLTVYLLVFWSAHLLAQDLGSCLFSLADSTFVIDLNEKAWKNKSNNPALSQRYTQTDLELAEEIGYAAGTASAMHTQAMIWWYQGRIDTATSLFFKALEIRDSLGDLLGLSRSYNNIGNAFFEQRKYEEALRYYYKGLSIRQQIEDSSGLVYSYSNIGDVFAKQKKYEQALASYQAGLALGHEIHFNDGIAHVADQMGTLAKDRSMPDSAHYYYQLALSIAEQSNHKNQIARSLVHLMHIELENPKSDLNKYARQAERAHLLALEIGALDLQTETCRLLADIYARMGDYQKAYLMQQDYMAGRMEEIQLGSEKSLLEASVRYQEVQKEKKKEQVERGKERKLFFYSFIMGMLVIILMVLQLRNTRNNIQHQQHLQALAEDKQQQIEHHNEILRNKNQALEQFMFAISHDLKEPLRTISSFAGLLERRYKDSLGHDSQAYIQYIVKGVHQMYRLLEDTLLFSRLARQDEVKWEKTDLNDIMARVSWALQDRLQANEAQLECMPLPTLATQPVRIQQLFTNLISNALKFRRSTPPHIQIGYEPHPDCHTFWVKDNGIGIDSAFFDKIFQPFHRLNRQDYEGTGLGLAICRQIVQQQGGKLWVESQVGEGSTFYFTLPLARTHIPSIQSPNLALVH